MKAWLKGGLIGIGVAVLFLIIDIIITRFVEFHLFSTLAGFLGIWIYQQFFIHVSDPLKSIIFFVPTFILYFVVGTIIGLIISKINSRNK